MDRNKIDDISDDVYIFHPFSNMLEGFNFDQIFSFLCEIGNQVQVRF